MKERCVPRARTGLRSALAWVALVLACLTTALPARSSEVQEERSRIGVRLFRALLQADLKIGEKTVDGGKLLVVFFYDGDERTAKELASEFRSTSSPGTLSIRGIPVEIEMTSDPTFGAYRNRIPAGIFIAEPTARAPLKELIRFGIDHHVIVYSPFEGDVELGVLCGLSIEAQVRPYLNEATLRESGIEIKSIFLKVTKVYR